MAIVVLGNGLVGSEFIRQTGWDCIARDKHGFDIRKMGVFDPFLRCYDTIINCIGFVDDYHDRQRNWETNWLPVIDLVEWCNANDKKLVHMSSDCVYRGRAPFASETDVPVHENNWYAYTKLLADGYVQARAHNYLMVRITLKGRPFPFDVVHDRIGNFDYVDKVVSLIVRLIKMDAYGVYNVGTAPKRLLTLARETKPTIETNGDEPQDYTMNLDKMKAMLSHE